MRSLQCDNEKSILIIILISLLRCFHTRLWTSKMQLNYTWKNLLMIKKKWKETSLNQTMSRFWACIIHTLYLMVWCTVEYPTHRYFACISCNHTIKKLYEIHVRHILTRDDKNIKWGFVCYFDLSIKIMNLNHSTSVYWSIKETDKPVTEPNKKGHNN